MINKDRVKLQQILKLFLKGYAKINETEVICKVISFLFSEWWKHIVINNLIKRGTPLSDSLMNIWMWYVSSKILEGILKKIFLARYI